MIGRAIWQIRDTDGFDIDAIRTNDAYRFLSDRAAGATTRYGVSSISIHATRR